LKKEKIRYLNKYFIKTRDMSSNMLNKIIEHMYLKIYTYVMRLISITVDTSIIDDEVIY
jgi:hypothetical protein